MSALQIGNTRALRKAVRHAELALADNIAATAAELDALPLGSIIVARLAYDESSVWRLVHLNHGRWHDVAASLPTVHTSTNVAEAAGIIELQYVAEI